MDYKLIMIGLLLGIIGHAISWFSMNSQFIWEFWSTKPFLAAVIFGLPSNIVFWFATKYTREAINNTWMVRWILFAMSFPPMFVLTSTIFGDAFVNTRNLLTLFFALCIILTQFFIR